MKEGRVTDHQPLPGAGHPADRELQGEALHRRGGADTRGRRY